MNYKQTIIVSSLILLCITPIISNAVPATIVNFSEHEQGSGELAITMTITDDYLRIDDRPVKQLEKNKEDNKGFVLYDRKNKAVYSVSSEEQQIIKIQHVAVTIPSPIELKLTKRRLPEDTAAPLIKGKKTQHHQIYVNNKLCTNMITVPELMPDVVIALQNFNQTLAGQQAETLRYIPADLHEPCELARHSFYAQSHLENGFPVMLQSIAASGQADDVKRSRMLIDFKQENVADDYFRLPDYDIFTINQ